MQKVNIYTMTSFSGMKKQDGAAVYILEMETGSDPVTLQDSQVLQNKTPNAAELLAVKEALRRMRKKCGLTIYTESSYVAAGFTAGWVKKWKENEWKTARGREVTNREIWEELDSLLNGHEYEFKVLEPHEYRLWMKREAERKKGEMGQKL